MNNKITIEQIKTILKTNKMVTINSKDIETNEDGSIKKELLALPKIHPWIVKYSNKGNEYVFFQNVEVFNEFQLS